MSNCIIELVSKGYVEEFEIANEETKRIEKDGYGILHLWDKPDKKNPRYFKLNHCPACGATLTPDD